MYKCKSCGVETTVLNLNWLSDAEPLEYSDEYGFTYQYDVEVVCNCGHVQLAKATTGMKVISVEDVE